MKFCFDGNGAEKAETSHALSTVGLGGSMLFRQLLPFPVYANVCLSSIGLSGGGIVMASQHGFKFQRLSQWPSG